RDVRLHDVVAGVLADADVDRPRVALPVHRIAAHLDLRLDRAGAEPAPFRAERLARLRTGVPVVEVQGGEREIHGRRPLALHGLRHVDVGAGRIDLVVGAEDGGVLGAGAGGRGRPVVHVPRLRVAQVDFPPDLADLLHAPRRELPRRDRVARLRHHPLAPRLLALRIRVAVAAMVDDVRAALVVPDDVGLRADLLRDDLAWITCYMPSVVTG